MVCSNPAQFPALCECQVVPPRLRAKSEICLFIVFPRFAPNPVFGWFALASQRAVNEGIAITAKSPFFSPLQRLWREKGIQEELNQPPKTCSRTEPIINSAV